MATQVRGDPVPSVADEIDRTIDCTPSPTPSETLALTNWGKAKRQDSKKQERKWALPIIIIIVLAVLLGVYNNRIVSALKPATNWMYRTPGGWLIPIALLIILSFPPLLGHELVLIIVGFTWGLGIGFGIACAGTYFGELATYYFARWLCMARAAKYEKDNIPYGATAHVIRNGGLWMVIVARYGTIPPHLLTAILAVCGISVKTFSIAAILALPRQFATVYLGFALRSSKDGHPSKTSNIVQYVAIGFTIVVTIISGWYMDKHERAVVPEVVYQRRKARQVRMRAGVDHDTHDSEDIVLAALPPSLPAAGVSSEQGTDQHGAVEDKSSQTKLPV